MDIKQAVVEATAWIAGAVAVVLVFSALVSGCEAYNEGQQETKRVCIKSGGTWVTGDCVSNKSK